MPETSQVTAPDPQAGGRYVRNEDCSLTQVHKTEEAPNISESPAAPAPAPAPEQE